VWRLSHVARHKVREPPVCRRYSSRAVYPQAEDVINAPKEAHEALAKACVFMNVSHRNPLVISGHDQSMGLGDCSSLAR
jgi:hypothetical protein